MYSVLQSVVPRPPPNLIREEEGEGRFLPADLLDRVF